MSFDDHHNYGQHVNNTRRRGRDNNNTKINKRTFICEQSNEKKFIGGAEQARRNAMKKRFKRCKNHHHHGTSSTTKSSSSSYHHHHHHYQRLPKSMKPSERFFASLLLSSVSHLEESNLDRNTRENVMRDICGRIGVPLPAKLPATYDNAHQYYSTRASLVLEESRCILSDALLQCKNSRPQKRQQQKSMQMKLVSLQEEKKSNYLVLHLKKIAGKTSRRGGDKLSSSSSSDSSFFTPQELYNMKPGCCFKITIQEKQEEEEEILSATKNNSDDDGDDDDGDDDDGNPFFNNSSFISMTSNKKPCHTVKNEKSVLASVTFRRNFNENDDDDDETLGTLSLMVFRTEGLITTDLGTIWEVTPVTTLISQMRQLEACIRATKVDFLPKLLAWKERTHIRFDDDDDDDDDNDNDDDDDSGSGVDDDGDSYSDDGEEKKMDDEDMEIINHRISDRKMSDDNDDDDTETKDLDIFSLQYDTPSFLLPTLNPTQEKAAKKFISSPPSTLTLVQGPPGTGKTTFLVSTMCRCLDTPTQCYDDNNESPSNNKRRILVTAPTNKAITVLATRFLDALNGNETFNVVMIGVEDKLVSTDGMGSTDNDPFVASSLSSSLRGIFVYTWVQSIIEIFQSFQNELQADENIVPKAISVVNESIRLKNKLCRSLPYQYDTSGASDLTDKFITCVKDVISSSRTDGNKASNQNFLLEKSILSLNLLTASLGVIDPNDATQELLARADVIFCTLSSAGVVAMKQTVRVDDLFVDEAAAATEPEICIPFHLKPSRMLAVGDPMQLPATIMSRHAMNFGLDKSMHERLMYDCRKEHIMLDIQYRMKPEISKFPSTYFYGGKLLNGSNVSTNYHGSLSILNGNPYSFLQVNGTEQQLHGASFSNEDEARVVVELVKDLQRQYSEGKHPMTKLWDSADSIRIITFYQGQVALIRRLLQQIGLGSVLVATVDSSQGCEADLVIVSFVRSNKKQGGVRRTAGFLTDCRRMNVALTRARYQLICVGNACGTLKNSGDKTLQAIVNDAESRKVHTAFKPNR